MQESGEGLRSWSRRTGEKLIRGFRREPLLVVCIALVLVLRIAAVFSMGMMPQDAYYYFIYGQHLSLSYYDHPPMIGYLLHLSGLLFGSSVVGIKITDFVTTVLTALAFYRLSVLFLTPEQARRSVVLFVCSLMVTILSLISTPDVPLMLFWCLALIALHHAVFEKRKLYWIWAGLCMGLAFDSKYTGLLLPVGLMGFLLLSTSHRGALRSRGFWLAMVIFVVMAAPVIIWNYQHDFASFRFQSGDRAASMNLLDWKPLSLLGVVGHQSAILTPFVFLGLCVVLFQLTKTYLVSRRKLPADVLFLVCFWVPVFAGAIAVSMIYWVKLNWIMPAYVTGLILLVRYMAVKWVRRAVIFSAVTHVALALELFFYPVPVKSDDTWFGWEQLAGKVKQLSAEYPDAFVFSADENKTSSVLSFYLHHLVYSTNIIGENALHFDYIHSDLSRLEGKSALFINSVPNFRNTGREHQYPQRMDLLFDSVQEMDPIIIRNKFGNMRKFLVFYCSNYHPVDKSRISLR